MSDLDVINDRLQMEKIWPKSHEKHPPSEVCF